MTTSSLLRWLVSGWAVHRELGLVRRVEAGRGEGKRLHILAGTDNSVQVNSDNHSDRTTTILAGP